MSRQVDKSAAITLRFYWQFVRQYPYTITGLFLALPAAILTSQYLPPYILSKALNRLSTGNYIPHDLWQSFHSEILAYAVIGLLGGLVLWRTVDIFVWRLEGNITRDISRKIFAHLIGQSADFHANRFSGSLVSQTNKTLTSYVRLADTTWFLTLPLAVGIVLSGIILWPKSPLYVASLIVFAVLYIVVSILVSKPVRITGAKHASAESKQTGYLSDAITNVMAIKSFAGEDYENASYKKAVDFTHRRLIDVMRAHRRQMFFFSGMSSLISTGAFIIALIGVVNFNADIATMFLILSYTTNIVSQLFAFSNQGLRNYNRGIGDAADMIAILGLEREIKDPELPEEPRIRRGEISFHDVTFTHTGAEDSIFKALQLKIKPGEKVGLVGHSGSGKTSLTRILLRFSDIDSGSITIDGQNIAAITQADLHRAISYVPQEPLLFHRTIEENIGYGNPSASREEIEAVARKANAHEFIQTLPKGYDTLVGERGVKLSGGQRQRVAIARAMLKNAPILVLDEATSALDSESEALIQDALWKLMEDRTAIVIAHRLSTIQRMDRIIVLENGTIVEQGTHKELVRQGGVYAGLWERQSGGFLEE